MNKKIMKKFDAGGLVLKNVGGHMIIFKGFVSEIRISLATGNVFLYHKKPHGMIGPS